LVFKGGTSLSKVFGVIERFSEDIDLSLSPAFLKLPKAGTSRNQANRWMAKAEAACGAAVRNQIGPAMEAAAVGVLGKNERAWFEFMTDLNTNSPVLFFHYPSSQPAGFDYLKRSVKLEFGSLTDQQPVGRHSVRPWVADVLPGVFPDWRCEVVALEVERSFWEKATILHTEYHRPSWPTSHGTRPACRSESMSRTSPKRKQPSWGNDRPRTGLAGWNLCKSCKEAARFSLTTKPNVTQ
jgi:hypothetical protein